MAAEGLSPTAHLSSSSTAALAKGEAEALATGGAPPVPSAVPQTGKAREGTKQAQLLAMLGASGRRDD